MNEPTDKRPTPQEIEAAHAAAVGRETRASHQLKFEALVATFPALRGAPGTNPWDVHRFMSWACGGISHGEVCCARLVLGIWNPSTDWVKEAKVDGIRAGWAKALKRFDLIEAVGVLDGTNADALAAWILNPYWP